MKFYRGVFYGLLFSVALWIILFSGCSYVRKSIDSYKACRADPDCAVLMSNEGEKARVVTNTLVSGFPDNVLGTLVGS